jgi:light-regulated signal transduction histidine kinase (bacteriophytochrome)
LTLLGSIARAELRPSDVDLSDLALSIVAELKARDPARRADFKIERGVVRRADPNLTRLLLQHLLENAWNFSRSRDPAQIEFGATSREGAPWLFVRDNGAGFDPEYARKLFRPFQRLHPRDAFPGVGIGLAAAQRIVKRHGGEIRAEAAPEAGAAFYFNLP